MNYYSHHIGDYLLDTAHLTFVEDAAYRRLMDRYYTQEAPLVNDLPVLCRIVRAITPEEKQAVETVLAEFFTLTEDGWSHKRCNKEIAAYKAKAEVNRENGTKGGRPKKPELSTEKTQSVISGNPQETLTNNQEPITKNQEPLKERTASPKTRSPKKTPLPEGFSISPAVRAWAEEKGHANLEAHLESFIGKAKAAGYVYADWDQALQNAVRDDWAKLNNRPAGRQLSITTTAAAANTDGMSAKTAATIANLNAYFGEQQ
jgi:uncharacterized protein YdaU (DUF1376 family)